MSKVSGYGAYQQASYMSSAVQKKKDEAKTNKTGSAQNAGKTKKRSEEHTSELQSPY